MEGLESHPLIFIEHFFKQLPWVSFLELGIYHYIPHTDTDKDRTITKTPAHKLTETFQKLKSSLHPNEDIAFQSKIYGTDGKIYQIILVDFISSNLDSIQNTVSEITAFSESPTSILAYSGRSFHLYTFSLHHESKWISLMGKCLLCNKKDKEKIVDDRWIGHRLVSGYGALRLTCNNKNYISEPYVVKIL